MGRLPVAKGKPVGKKPPVGTGHKWKGTVAKYSFLEMFGHNSLASPSECTSGKVAGGFWGTPVSDTRSIGEKYK